MAQYHTVSATALYATADPFNWPSLNRGDLMSLQTLGAERDMVRIKTANVTRRSREASKNLETLDIFGAQPKKWARETNKPDFLG